MLRDLYNEYFMKLFKLNTVDEYLKFRYENNDFFSFNTIEYHIVFRFGTYSGFYLKYNSGYRRFSVPYIKHSISRMSIPIDKFQEMYEDDPGLFQLSLIGEVDNIKKMMYYVPNLTTFFNDLMEIRKPYV